MIDFLKGIDAVFLTVIQVLAIAFLVAITVAIIYAIIKRIKKSKDTKKNKHSNKVQKSDHAPNSTSTHSSPNDCRSWNESNAKKYGNKQYGKNQNNKNYKSKPPKQHKANSRWAENREKGIEGERLVSNALHSCLKENEKIINNFLMHSLLDIAEKKYAQIDHIIISHRGIFVVETKNWSGKIR